jgi:hypothetical protein
LIAHVASKLSRYLPIARWFVRRDQNSGEGPISLACATANGCDKTRKRLSTKCSSMKPLNEDRSSRENQSIHVMPDFTAFLEFP